MTTSKLHQVVFPKKYDETYFIMFHYVSPKNIMKYMETDEPSLHPLQDLFLNFCFYLILFVFIFWPHHEA